MNSNFDSSDEIVAHNREAWDSLVREKDRWTIPVTSEEIERARNDDWRIFLTPETPLPREWFPDFRARSIKVLCLAGGGGQQGPILAAAGAVVTVFDNSPAQLAQDKLVANREHLVIDLVQGDMADLSVFDDDTFDLIVHPCSNCFIPDVLPVWKEAARVMKRGANLLSGVVSPIVFLFDSDLMEVREFKVSNELPYSDLTSLSSEQRRAIIDNDEPLSFGHTLTDQIGGQVDAGLAITAFFEDRWQERPISKYIATSIVTKATKLR